LLHDLRRVIAQQGMPRYDIEIVLDEALKQMPAAAKNNPGQQEQWLSRLVETIADYYDRLEPDSAFAHTSAVKLNRPIGTLDSNSLGAAPALIEALERMSIRALKSMPFMMGLSESSTETQANRQAESHYQSIRSVQHLVENQLGGLLTLGLQAQGIVSDVVVAFAENRSAEEMRDQQVRQLKQANASAGYAAGHLSQDEAAHYAWDKETADQTEPRAAVQPAAGVSNGAMENPQPDTKRSAPVNGRRSAPVKLLPLGHDQPFAPLVPLTALSEDEKAALSETFDRGQPTNGKFRGLLLAEVEE
jgi:hypothetical protein